MTHSTVHQPPPDQVVDALVRAGLSRTTVRAMEWWKANEVLELLRMVAADGRQEPAAPARGTL